MIFSYSNLNTWDICPRQFEHRYMLKDVPYVETDAMKWGNQVHTAFENRINKGTPFPMGMKLFEKYTDFGSYMVQAEVKLGMTSGGYACDFFDPNAWLRGKVDVLIQHKDRLGTAYLRDWKTGKRREDPEELAIGAVLVKAKHLEFETIKGDYVWLKDDQIGQQHDLSATKQKLEMLHHKTDQIQHQMKMGYMPPKQGPLCGWCPVKSCEFHPEHT